MVYAELTELGLDTTSAATFWRQLMITDLSFFRSETSQRLREEGRAEGHVAGHAEGVLRILDKRGIDVPLEVRRRVRSCTDEAIIDAWYDRALTAATAEDLFHEE